MRPLLCVAIVALTLSFSITHRIHASEPVGVLAPNAMYEDFINDLDQIHNVEYDYLQAVHFYKKLTDTKAKMFSGTRAVGVMEEPSGTTTYINNSSRVDYETGTGRKSDGYQMDIVTKDDVIYVNFPTTGLKALKGKWFNIPASKYTEATEKIGPVELFEAGVMSSSIVRESAMDKSFAVAKKHNLFFFSTEEIDDGQIVENAKRYDLLYDSDAIEPYYRELSKVLSGEEKSETVLSIEGFESSLSRSEFVEHIGNYSYVSLWIDTTTHLPRRMREIVSLPPLPGFKYFTVMTNDFEWTNANAANPDIDVPIKNTLTYGEAAKIMKIQVDDPLKNVVIEELLAQLKGAKTKADKADIYYSLGGESFSVGEYENASNYYKKAASYYGKETPDYYDAVGSAFWALGKGTETIRTYEAGLKKFPNDLLLMNAYGWFLLGLGSKSYPYRDLERALEINKALVSKYVSDDTFINLYINYLMRNNVKEADILKDRFDNFDSARNYNLIAKAYHALRDTKKSEEMRTLAKDEGYVETVSDRQFFDIKF